MKTNKQHFRKVALALFVSVCTLSGAMANESAILNSDPIDITGYTHEAPVTDHELETVKGELRKQKNAIVINKEKAKNYKQLSRTTEKLADTTETLIEDRSESQATIDRFNKKIECLMNKETVDPDCDKYLKKEVDTVSVAQAAPVQSSQNLSIDTNSGFGSVIKVLPYVGFTSMNSQNESVEASYAVGLNLESDISERFSLGLGVNYTTLKTVDFFGSTNGIYQSSNHNDYANFYGNGREIQYSNIGFEAYSKFFITKTNRFRPYVGAGLSYNRTQMSYSDNREQQIQYGSGANNLYYQYGDEEVVSSSMKISLSGGTEIKFSENLGMNLELAYSRGLGGNLSSQNKQYTQKSPDQKRLQDLNEELLEANNFSVFGGMLFTF